MISHMRLALVLALTLSVGACGTPGTTPPSGMQAAATAPKAAPKRELTGYGPGPVKLDRPRAVWAQDYSDIAPDPAIRFGTLPNGMRYAIMKNATPSGQASLRLRFDAGSIQERDDQQGLAHFLEHMAFNGSKAVPEGEMIKILERLGLAFGADTNASTSQTETVYKLDLPRTDDETVDTSMRLLREAASELLIDQAAVDRERGIVLSEERARDTPSYRVYQDQLRFFLGDHIATKRMPIGKAEILRTAPRGAIEDFYKAYYRPERTTFVAVGDFDPAVMEAKIKARFGDWKNTAPAGAEAPLTLPIKRNPETRVMTAAGAPLMLSIGWVAPPDLDKDSTAERREGLVEQLGFAVLNRRLERLARSGEPPFIAAGAYSDVEYQSAKMTSLDVRAQPGRWREALEATITEQRRAAQYGVSDVELKREIDSLLTSAQAGVAAQATRRTPRLADIIVGSLEEGLVVTNPTQNLAFYQKVAPTISAKEVSAALNESFAGAGPLVFLSTPEPIANGESLVTAALNETLAKPVAAGEAQIVKTWPYERFGAPGKVAEQTDIADLDTVFVRFENGVRLTVKQTKFRDDQILVAARIGTGRLAFPTDKVTAAWSLPSSFIEGGLKDLDVEDIDQIMTSKIVGADMGVEDDAITLSGGTRPEDIKTELQLLTAYAIEPGWRPEAFQRMKTYGATLHDQQDATAGGVMGRELARLMRSGDARWAFPSRAEIAAGKPEDVRSLLEKQLATGPVEVLIVGDITVEKAIEAVAETFGSLPARPAPTVAQASSLTFPASNEASPVILTHKGRADQVVGFMAWKTDDFFKDTHKSRSLRVMGDILDLRLIDEVREKQGATYSPQTSIASSSVFPGFGFAAALIDTQPDKVQPFFTTVEQIAADLRDKPVSQDELDRAKKPAIEALQKRMETNEFWLGQLSGAQTDPRKLTSLRSALSGIQRVTAADVQAVAREYLKPGQTWRLIVRPQAAK